MKEKKKERSKRNNVDQNRHKDRKREREKERRQKRVRKKTVGCIRQKTILYKEIGKDCVRPKTLDQTAHNQTKKDS